MFLTSQQFVTNLHLQLFLLDSLRLYSQLLSTIAKRASIVRWIVETVENEGEKHIAYKAVAKFPDLFRESSNANLTKASRLWKQRSSYLPGCSSLRGLNTTITRRKAGLSSAMILKPEKEEEENVRNCLSCCTRNGTWNSIG